MITLPCSLPEKCSSLLKKIKVNKIPTNFVIKHENGNDLTAHKEVLADNSDFFAAMLKCELDDGKSGTVDLSYLDYIVLKKIVRSFYRDILELKFSETDAAMNIASYLQITALPDLLDQFFHKMTTIENWSQVIRISHKHGFRRSYLCCIEHFNRGPYVYSQDRHFNTLPIPIMKDILSLNCVNAEEDDLLLWCVDRAVRNKSDNDWIELVSCIRFQHCSEGFLAKLASSQPKLLLALPRELFNYIAKKTSVTRLFSKELNSETQNLTLKLNRRSAGDTTLSLVTVNSILVVRAVIGQEMKVLTTVPEPFRKSNPAVAIDEFSLFVVDGVLNEPLSFAEYSFTDLKWKSLPSVPLRIIKKIGKTPPHIGIVGNQCIMVVTQEFDGWDFSLGKGNVTISIYDKQLNEWFSSCRITITFPTKDFGKYYGQPCSRIRTRVNIRSTTDDETAYVMIALDYIGTYDAFGVDLQKGAGQLFSIDVKTLSIEKVDIPFEEGITCNALYAVDNKLYIIDDMIAILELNREEKKWVEKYRPIGKRIGQGQMVPYSRKCVYIFKEDTEPFKLIEFDFLKMQWTESRLKMYSDHRFQRCIGYAYVDARRYLSSAQKGKT